VHGDRAWEVSHIGGDRFAGNLVCFPHGLYFGRLDPDAGVAVAERYAQGQIDLAHYRGRSCYGFAVQAAETFLRRQLDLTGVEDVRLVRIDWPAPQMLEATFDTPGGRPAVRVAVHAADQVRTLTCHSTVPARPPIYSLVGVAHTA
jgi:hypothetical protein